MAAFRGRFGFAAASAGRSGSGASTAVTVGGVPEDDALALARRFRIAGAAPRWIGGRFGRRLLRAGAPFRRGGLDGACVVRPLTRSWLRRGCLGRRLGRGHRRRCRRGAACRAALAAAGFADSPVGTSWTGVVGRRERRSPGTGRGRHRVRIALGERLEQQDRPRHRRVEGPDDALHRDAHEQVAPAADGGPSPWPSLPTTMASGPRRSVSRAVIGASPSAPATRTPRLWRSLRAPGRSSTGHKQEVLDGAGRRLDRRRAERRLAMRREQDAVHAGRLGAAQERPDVVRILERVEDEDERRLAALRGPGEDVVQAREPARFDDERHALVAIEAGQRRQRATFDLDDRDPQVRGMEHELLEGRRGAAARPAGGWPGVGRRRPPRPGGDRRRAPPRVRGPRAAAGPPSAVAHRDRGPWAAGHGVAAPSRSLALGPGPGRIPTPVATRTRRPRAARFLIEAALRCVLVRRTLVVGIGPAAAIRVVATAVVPGSSGSRAGPGALAAAVVPRALARSRTRAAAATPVVPRPFRGPWPSPPRSSHGRCRGPGPDPCPNPGPRRSPGRGEARWGATDRAGRHVRPRAAGSGRGPSRGPSRRGPIGRGPSGVVRRTAGSCHPVRPASAARSAGARDTRRHPVVHPGRPVAHCRAARAAVRLVVDRPAAGQPRVTSTRRRQRWPSRVSSTDDPASQQLVAQPVGGRPVSRVLVPPHAHRADAGCPGRDHRRSSGSTPSTWSRSRSSRQSAPGIVGREGPRLDPTVQVSDEVEQRGQRLGDVEVVVERRAERLASRGQRLGKVRVGGSLLAIRLEGRDERVEPGHRGGRGGQRLVGVVRPAR